MSVTTMSPFTSLREALERALVAEQALRSTREAHAVEDVFDAILIFQSKLKEALDNLDTLITDQVGMPPWTVLLAGHLIHSSVYDPPIIIPIEHVIHLDTLRRFP
jgi:hypothetical protein